MGGTISKKELERWEMQSKLEHQERKRRKLLTLALKVKESLQQNQIKNAREYIDELLNVIELSC